MSTKLLDNLLIAKYLISVAAPLMKNILMPLAKSVLITLVLTAAASAADAEIHKKILGSGRSSAPKTMTLIISNGEAQDIIEIVKSLEISGLFLKGVSKTI